jgi:lactoylglutathione lyase
MQPATRVMPMLSVADMAAALRFYRDTLGGQQIYQFPEAGEPVFLTLRFGDTELGIGLLTDAPMHGRPQRPATGHRVELCINVANADEAVAALDAIGAKTVTPPVDLPWGERSAYVEDPDGNLVMLAAPGKSPA